MSHHLAASHRLLQHHTRMRLMYSTCTIQKLTCSGEGSDC